MSLTYAGARDEMLTIVNQAWAPTGLTMVWDDLESNIPVNEDSWARTTLSHTQGFQATLSNDLGSRKFRRLGLLIVQIFTPSSNGLSLSDNYSKLIIDAFEGKRTLNGIWFKDVRLNEVGADGNYFQSNVLVNFEYDEIK
jgi:hypothetical protein